ncbi:putative nucleoside diphosphate-linked moiety X motif 19, mitochondrial-like [Apostichopus japonicus]|uniref:Putative nucleoside diphosphate-linked moiety X motif 19, mitochondrial-like n=1 Tax=Stichopus japonicus TaxID=307972 RepID=A0A2G8JYJ7_STIJA|nr:putative nucleoside diphosphate-linked moiety X motif 19, mitochondrial-like [Apostichopus japonicus]
MSDVVKSDTTKQSLNRPWREAATLVIASKNDTPCISPRTATFDYRILLLQRDSQSRSFAGASVFPGGVVDPADFSPKWFQLFSRLGIWRGDDFGWSHMKGKPRAGPIAAQRDEGLLPNDVAFRICAIRETFEESGILLAVNEADVKYSISRMKNKQFVPSTSYCDSMNVRAYDNEWRRRVHDDAYQFLEMCMYLDVYPNIWSLFELSTVLTPPITSRRYDTIFYICSLEKEPYAEVDQKEMIDLQWLTPAEAIRKHCRHEIQLPMPQISECARLLDYRNISEIQGYAVGQMDQGMLAEVPAPIKLKDAFLRVLPGDDCYPGEVKYLQMEESEEENLKRCKNLNRYTYRSDGHFTLICNVTPLFGQRPPRDIDSRDWLDEAKL